MSDNFTVVQALHGRRFASKGGRDKEEKNGPRKGNGN